jgi:hypothetical protein
MKKARFVFARKFFPAGRRQRRLEVALFLLSKVNNRRYLFAKSQ